MNLNGINWMDYAWLILLILIILAILIDRMRKTKQKIVRRTIKNIGLTPNKWELLNSLAKDRRTTSSNLIADVLTQYLNNIR